MNYINTTTGEYPVTEATIRAASPNTSFPAPFVAPQGYAQVFPAPQPAYNPVTHGVREIAPALTDKGHYEQRWEVFALDQQQADANTAAARAAKWEAIKALRDQKVQTGGYQVGSKWYHSDTFSRTQQIGLVMMGANIPAGLQWKTMDGTFVTMTQQLAAQVFAAAAAQDAALFAHAENLRAQVNAAADPAGVDIAAGWPATYGGT